jgi:hypothetical protein
MIWHDTLNEDPAHRWLRNHLMAICETL